MQHKEGVDKVTEHLHELKDKIPDPTLRRIAENMLRQAESTLGTECRHKEITFSNVTGFKHENFSEVDFLITCNLCKKELFRMSEYGKTIINVSKH